MWLMMLGSVIKPTSYIAWENLQQDYGYQQNPFMKRIEIMQDPFKSNALCSNSTEWYIEANA